MEQYNLVKMLFLALSVSLMSSSLAVATPVENAFLVTFSPPSCTGTVIAKDWVLTAAHCPTVQYRVSKGRRNEHGDVVIEGYRNEYVYRTPSLSLEEIHAWTEPYSTGQSITDPEWRGIERIIVNA